MTAAHDAIQIPRRPRSEFPKVPGWYIVHDACSRAPLLLPWASGSTRWVYPKSVATVPVEGWIGPVLGVPEELA